MSTLQEIDPLQGSAPDSSIEINNVSRLPSESIRYCLDQFVSSDKHILLLIANMDEVTCAKLNYVRILIEESESGSVHRRKLFLILVGNPTLQLHSLCYPSLFVTGWDHTFLHTLQEHVDGFNMRHWITYSCIPSQESSLTNSLVQTIKKGLVAIAPKVSHTVSLAFQESVVFLTERSNQIEHLLVETEVGSILCDKFCSYFEQGMVLNYLRKIILLATSHGASHGIIESMQTAVQSDFSDFLIVMLSKVIENCNLDTLHQNYGMLQKLFWGILELLPLPEFTDIRFLSGALPSYVTISSETFPFFRIIFDSIESNIELCSDKKKSYDSNDLINQLHQNVLQNVTVQHQKVWLCVFNFNMFIWLASSSF